MVIFEKYKTVYLSSNIQMVVFHVKFRGTYIKISDISTKRGISLWRPQLYILIQQIKQYTKPNIEHPRNWSWLKLQANFIIKRIPFSDKFLLINKSLDRIVLDKFSIASMIDMENVLFSYLNKIELKYDQID